MKKLLPLVLIALLLNLAAAQSVKIAVYGAADGRGRLDWSRGARLHQSRRRRFQRAHRDERRTRQGDTEINPDVGRVVAERLAADPDLYVVVGPMGSQVCEATQPIFEDAGLAQITQACTRTDLTDPGTPTFFRPIPSDADQSKTIVDIWMNDP